MLRKAMSEILCRREYYRLKTKEKAAIAAMSPQSFSKMAELLQANRSTLYKQIDTCELEPPKFQYEIYLEIHRFLVYLKKITDILRIGDGIYEDKTD